MAKGAAPKVWRVGRGQFRLVADPADDLPTQDAERRRALGRAAELRPRESRTSSRQDEGYASAPARSGSQFDPVPVTSGRYPSFAVALNPTERRDLASLSKADKAESIVRKHLSDRYGRRAEIEKDRDGADLKISVDGRIERVVVMGTESPTLDWHELKVSSRESHDALISGDALMYRVVDVSGPNPRIYVLTYGRHFTLEPEPRWAIKHVPPRDDRYPLRGEPYRFDLPHEPVAGDDWAIQP